MKYVTAWKIRFGGSAAENEATAARIAEVYSKWTPPSGVTFHQFVARIDGQGGFAVTESDDPNTAAALDIAKLSPYLEYTVYPVMDLAENAGLFVEAVEWRKSIT